MTDAEDLAPRSASGSVPADPVSEDARIVLIGPMAAGKSVLATALARRLGRVRADSDAVIVERHGSVPRLFSDRGEEYFRQVEADVVAELLTDPGLAGAVVALGGGAPMTPSVRESLAGHVVVALTIDAETVRPRIAADPVRPLLRGGAKGANDAAPDPVGRWSELLEQRGDTYAALADVVLETGHDGTARDPEDLAEELVRALRRVPRGATGLRPASDDDPRTSSERTP